MQVLKQPTLPVEVFCNSPDALLLQYRQNHSQLGVGSESLLGSGPLATPATGRPGPSVSCLPQPTP